MLCPTKTPRIDTLGNTLLPSRAQKPDCKFALRVALPQTPKFSQMLSQYTYLEFNVLKEMGYLMFYPDP